jgi:hypothetical protein
MRSFLGGWRAACSRCAQMKKIVGGSHCILWLQRGPTTKGLLLKAARLCGAGCAGSRMQLPGSLAPSGPTCCCSMCYLIVFQTVKEILSVAQPASFLGHNCVRKQIILSTWSTWPIVSCRRRLEKETRNLVPQCKKHRDDGAMSVWDVVKSSRKDQESAAVSPSRQSVKAS